MASAVPHAVLRKPCQGVLCCLNIVHLHVTRMNVIMRTTVENMTFLAPLYAKLTNGKQYYDQVSYLEN